MISLESINRPLHPCNPTCTLKLGHSFYTFYVNAGMLAVVIFRCNGLHFQIRSAILINNCCHIGANSVIQQNVGYFYFQTLWSPLGKKARSYIPLGLRTYFWVPFFLKFALTHCTRVYLSMFLQQCTNKGYLFTCCCLNKAFIELRNVYMCM